MSLPSGSAPAASSGPSVTSSDRCVSAEGRKRAAITAAECVPPESKNLSKFQQHSWRVAFLMLVFAIVIALAGGLSVGFANKQFSIQSSKRNAESQNRVLLNSSVNSLYYSEASLQQQSRNLFHFLDAEMGNRTFSAPGELREALFQAYITAWNTWLARAPDVEAFNVYVPFCQVPDDGPVHCPIMTMQVSCSEVEGGRFCYYGYNDDEGTKLRLFRMNDQDPRWDDSVPETRVIDLNLTMYSNQTGAMNFFLPPTPMQYPEGTSHRVVTARQQQFLSNGMLAVCDAISYLQSWFKIFATTVPHADEAYSLLFSSEGDILACQIGVNKQTECAGNHKTCGCRDDTNIKSLVNAFIPKIPYGLFYRDVALRNDFTHVMTVGGNLAVFQDFLHFRTAYGKPNVIYFAAYATELNRSIGQEGVVEIVVCVVLIVLCVLILGSVATVALTQMQRVLEVVSTLATHAATYDTDAMERTLKAKSSVRRCFGTITSSAVIEEEFDRILDNLKAYRPFLPASLLAHAQNTDGDTLISVVSEDDNGGGVEKDDEERNATATGESWRASRSASGMAPLRTGAELSLSRHQPVTVLPCGAGPDLDGRNAGREATPLDLLTSFQSADAYASLPDPSTDGSAGYPLKGARRTLSAAAVGDPTAGEASRSAVGYPGGEATAMNDRLRMDGLRAVKGTIMVVELVGLAVDAKGANDVINYFLGTVLAHAKVSNGVVDIMNATRLVISFNCHYTVLRHQEKSVGCALGIQDDLLRAGFSNAVSIAIATGQLFVGTIGNEFQRARVMTGESITVAKGLTSLTQVLGVTILVTDDVAHASGGAACLPVDVVSFHRASSGTWVRYGVCEVIGGSTAAMSPALTQARKLFKLIRGRNVDGAAAAVAAIKKTAKEAGRKRCPRLERLMDLVEHDPRAIREGYSRRHVDWEPQAGDAALLGGTTGAHTATAAAATLQHADAAASSASDLRAATGLRSAEDRPPPEGQPRPPGDPAPSFARAPPQLMDETERAREIMDNVRRVSHDRDRERASAMQQGFDQEESLFPIFLPIEDDELPYQPRPVPRDPQALNTAGPTQAATAGAAAADVVAAHQINNATRRITNMNGESFFRTSELLGRGAFGEVYLAISESGGFVAAKVFPVESASAPRVIHEVKTLSKLRDEHIVAYDCCGIQGHQFFILTEYMAAGSLQCLIKHLGPIPSRAARKYCRDILCGLAYLHKSQVLHCDIKPDNVLLTSEGVCKIADFGAAALARGAGAEGVRGTPRFMAPEAVLGEWSPAADIYSFGMTLATVVRGRQPWHAFAESDSLFLAQYAYEVQKAKRTGAPCELQPDLRFDDDEVDGDLVHVIERCCTFDPASRPTVDELLDMLL